jgi:hypothetical protein
MAGEAEKIQCAFCRREIEDTHDPTIHCRFCGKKFRRVDVFDEDEKSMRQNMIIDLSTYMSKLKITKNVAAVLGIFCLAAAVLLLFAEEAILIIWLLLPLFTAGFVIWMVVWGLNSKKYSQNQSKLFDLTGGRRLE